MKIFLKNKSKIAGGKYAVHVWIGNSGIDNIDVFLNYSCYFTGLWIWTLVDIIKSEFTGSNKIIWIIVVLLIPVFGMILYYFIGRKQKVRVAV